MPATFRRSVVLIADKQTFQTVFVLIISQRRFSEGVIKGLRRGIAYYTFQFARLI